ncbi:MAG: 50S ribosomal protein L18e [Nanoarchaeota archaeon]|nr:50S ribosomal protein L18e [Nanoarchaeota archaeon]
MKRTGPTNPVTKKIIEDLVSDGHKEKSKIKLDIAETLSKPRRQKIEVNLSQLQRVCKENETIVVPGKVLSYGILTKPLNVVALSFSKEAEKKIMEVGGKTLPLAEIVKTDMKGVKLIK